jgi:2-keto-4-pentenoate hydratase/2-oxohepta-3-ene-1,7-dioic acid hydratase in catechol pathway
MYENAMQIARFETDEGPRSALVLGDELAPLPLTDPLENRGEMAFGLSAAEFEAAAEEAVGKSTRIPLAEASLLSPVGAPTKIFAIGLNYADHIAESGMETPEVPTVMAKFPSSINGPGGAVERPKVSDRLDYEGELALVIGKRARHVSREEARGVIAGFLIHNDYSVRDWQMQTQQWSLAKSFDTHGPIGPWITTGTEIDPTGLRIETKVNGEVRQQSNTENLVFDVYDLVAYLSQACTLYPGDVIATGTPAGIGALMDPPQYLVPGDEVVVEVEGLGQLENVIIDEPGSGS